VVLLYTLSSNYTLTYYFFSIFIRSHMEARLSLLAKIAYDELSLSTPKRARGIASPISPGFSDDLSVDFRDERGSGLYGGTLDSSKFLFSNFENQGQQYQQHQQPRGFVEDHFVNVSWDCCGIERDHGNINPVNFPVASSHQPKGSYSNDRVNPP
jgi:hypothetical protein